MAVTRSVFLCFGFIASVRGGDIINRVGDQGFATVGELGLGFYCNFADLGWLLIRGD